MSQTSISRLTGLSRSTVWTVVQELKNQGLIRDQASIETVGRGGRPATRLLLNPVSIAVRPEVYSSLEIPPRYTVESSQVDQLRGETLLLAQGNARL